MVHLYSVAQFVQDYIVYEMLWQQYEVQVQAYCAAAAATAPMCAGVAHRYPLAVQVVLSG